MDLFDNPEFEHMYTVSEINFEIKELIETSLPAIWVQGEISNFTHHSSGHMYFSLKDPQAQISCVMWKSRNSMLHFAPADGIKVQIHGNVKVYERRGTLQIDVTKMIPAGIGDLQFAFEALKKRLNEEGLFDPEHKKSIPVYPEKIGIITSATGAAIQDIQNVIQRRFPAVKLVLRPAIVQGEDAPADIAKAIHEMNTIKNIDLLIVGRGGGSLEDLWAFNEEIVARAIFNSKIPVISAVGHEIDFTISDFVADLRAPTPSAAAELAVPDSRELFETLEGIRSFYTQHVDSLIRDNYSRINAIINSYGFKRPVDILNTYFQHLDELRNIMQVSTRHKLKGANQDLFYQKSRLKDLHPDSVLKRGYSITRKHDGSLLKSIKEVNIADELITQLQDGFVHSKSINIIEK